MTPENRAVDHNAERPVVGDYAKVPLDICGGCLGSLQMVMLVLGLVLQTVITVMAWIKGDENQLSWPITSPGVEGQLFFALSWLAWLINRERPATPIAFGITLLFLVALVVMIAGNQLFTIHTPPWYGDKWVSAAAPWIPTGIASALAVWFVISPRNRRYHRLCASHSR
jgi:hypothetical protein